MNNVPSMKIFLFCLSATISPLLSAAEPVNNLKVIAVYQMDDEAGAAFEFFTDKPAHKCGGKPSNRFRVYSRHGEVNDRKFRLIVDALAHQYKVSIGTEGCEGKAMKTGFIGVRR